MISIHSYQGERPRQEDAALAVEVGQTIILAVADGFAKGEAYGDKISKRVISIIGDNITWIAEKAVKYPDDTIRDLFHTIDHITSEESAGTTLALALVHQETRALFAVLGDSPAVALDVCGELVICPLHYLHLSGLKLWGCFGDSKNRLFHEQEPEMTDFFRLDPCASVILASDGLYPALSPSHVSQFARQYLAMATSGASAKELVTKARHLGSRENITAVMWSPP
jgi:serine/threonine protein phosphatase PrpC